MLCFPAQNLLESLVAAEVICRMLTPYVFNTFKLCRLRKNGQRQKETATAVVRIYITHLKGTYLGQRTVYTSTAIDLCIKRHCLLFKRPPLMLFNTQVKLSVMLEI